MADIVGFGGIGTDGTAQAAGGKMKSVRDLIDFHLRWHDFRPVARRVAARPGLTEDEAECIQWLIALADRISADDIALDDKTPMDGPI